MWYYTPRRYPGHSPKWQRFYTGPYMIQRACGPVNFVLQRSPKAKAFVAHADKLRPYYGRERGQWKESAPEVGLETRQLAVDGSAETVPWPSLATASDRQERVQSETDVAVVDGHTSPCQPLQPLPSPCLPLLRQCPPLQPRPAPAESLALNRPRCVARQPARFL